MFNVPLQQPSAVEVQLIIISDWVTFNFVLSRSLGRGTVSGGGITCHGLIM